MQRGDRVAPQEILAAGNSLQMFGITAGPITAKMIYVMSGRNAAMRQLVNKAMNKVGLAVRSNRSIATSVLAAGPFMAAIGAIEIDPFRKTKKERLLFHNPS